MAYHVSGTRNAKMNFQSPPLDVHNLDRRGDRYVSGELQEAEGFNGE